MKRRSFIQKTIVGTAGMVAAFHVPAFAQNRKIKIGLIGCGWYGGVINAAAFKTGNVEVVDWGIHHIDIIRKIMDFDIPKFFQTSGGLKILKGKITTPDTLRAMMNFEEAPVFWQQRLWGTGVLNSQFNNGVFFYGEKATIFASDRKLILMPAGRNQQQQEMEIPTPEMQEKHVADLINAVKAKDKSLLRCTIEDAWKSTSSVQLAMASYYTGNVVKWDAAAGTIVNNPEAARLLARPYREGYQRPAV